MAGRFFSTLFLFIVWGSIVNSVVDGEGTRVGFYSSTCPEAEFIVKSTVASHLAINSSVAPGLLRMHFHDCFVQGCDASVLISGFGTERTAPPNSGLKGYEVIDDAKAKLEAACPGVVSCADILALAARDSIVMTGGPSWEVLTGRRDGRVSQASDVGNLPSPRDSVDLQKQKFAEKGLDDEDLVILVGGGHSIGTAKCLFFSFRLYNFSGDGKADPSIDPSYLPILQMLCPKNSNASNSVALDRGSQNVFDKSYLENLKMGRGILPSDQALWIDASTKVIVQKFLDSSDLFNVKFAKSMIKMGSIGVKSGSVGEIRKKCSSIN